MTDRELLQQAIELMEVAIKAGDWKVDGACDPDMLFNSIRTRLAQPEPEPQDIGGHLYQSANTGKSREWQVLTDEEAIAIEQWSPDVRWAIICTEAKLKEKNNG